MAHQAYQPVRPCVSKYLQFKWDQSTYDMHQKKVSSAKATISRTPPKTYDHLFNKTKKKKLEEDRMSIIERDNHMLMEKISHIMRTTGGIDNKNDYISKRLSSAKRQQDLLQITEENLRILQRLTQCGPNYSIQLWQDDWVRTCTLMDSIGRYPRMNSVQSLKGDARSVKRGVRCHKTTQPGPEQNSDSAVVKRHECTEPCAVKDDSSSQEEKETNNQQGQENHQENADC
ncbi:hypothetical protein AALO_G00039100 [Alosa alosa]|uniref:Uncharacterized protein n=1 Tax=Alosa alosa TaxID=278164 RepID=A0AAV6H7M9_9TELE|nr:uncharacterized protein cfap97d2 [Alosa alosa]KAG5283170.1 hypothetical protein AALO_G00039100 [Alosa alosa]